MLITFVPAQIFCNFGELEHTTKKASETTGADKLQVNLYVRCLHTFV